MSVDKPTISRSQMSPQERQARSKLAQLVSQHGLIRGNLLVRRRKCGKPGCHCAHGEGHESLYLVVKEGGRTRQIIIPKKFQDTVRQWVEDYHQARQLLEEISSVYQEKLRNRQI